MDKKSLRQQYLKIRAELTPKYLEKANDEITTKTISFIKRNHFKKIGLFLGINQEVETIKIINFCLDQGIEVYLPHCFVEDKTMTFKLIHQVSKDLEKNLQLNVFQPHETCPDLANANDLDILFVPVVAFDEQLNRIGMGAGYYDRWLQTNRFKKMKIGLAFSVQKTAESFAVADHDGKLDFCITEETSSLVLKRLID